MGYAVSIYQFLASLQALLLQCDISFAKLSQGGNRLPSRPLRDRKPERAGMRISEDPQCIPPLTLCMQRTEGPHLRPEQADDAAHLYRHVELRPVGRHATCLASQSCSQL